MKKVTLLLSAIFVFGVSNIVKAQDDSDDSHTVAFTVPDFAILDIENSADKDITLTLGDGTNMEAGSEFNFAGGTNSDLWLNYTALTTKQGSGWNTRQVTVEVDAIVPGINLNLNVAADAGNGDGTVGTSSAIADAVTLTATAQPVITGIGSCYTGNGTSNGHNLTYSLEASDYALIEAGAQSVTVTYTIIAE